MRRCVGWRDKTPEAVMGDMMAVGISPSPGDVEKDARHIRTEMYKGIYKLMGYKLA